jgi:hypothetical protein
MAMVSLRMPHLSFQNERQQMLGDRDERGARNSTSMPLIGVASRRLLPPATT